MSLGSTYNQLSYSMYRFLFVFQNQGTRITRCTSWKVSIILRCVEFYDDFEFFCHRLNCRIHWFLRKCFLRCWMRTPRSAYAFVCHSSFNFESFWKFILQVHCPQISICVSKKGALCLFFINLAAMKKKFSYSTNIIVFVSLNLRIFLKCDVIYEKVPKVGQLFDK